MAPNMLSADGEYIEIQEVKKLVLEREPGEKLGLELASIEAVDGIDTGVQVIKVYPGSVGSRVSFVPSPCLALPCLASSFSFLLLLLGSNSIPLHHLPRILLPFADFPRVDIFLI
jgi:hypothetical protein